MSQTENYKELPNKKYEIQLQREKLAEGQKAP
jgi:hypothetical protein